MSDTSITNVSRALDSVPIGAFHRRLLGICGAAWAFDGMEVILISFTLTVFTGVWNLSGLSAGLLGSASLMGMVVGNWAWGSYADRYGRKRAFQATVLTYAVFTGLTALAWGFGSAFVLRFLTGVGLGGALAVDTTYLAEHLPSDVRGRYLVYLDAFWPLGNALAVVLAWIFLGAMGDAVSLPVVGTVAGWRLLFVAAAFPALTVFIIRAGLSETPYYLARTGQIEAANDRLRAIARESGGDYEPIEATDVERRGSASVRDLFAAGVRARTAMIFAALLAASFFTLGAWGAIYAYTPELFPTHLRATGNGFAGGVGKIAAVLGPILAGALVSTGYLAALAPLAVAFALGGLVVLGFGVETLGEPLR